MDGLGWKEEQEEPMNQICLKTLKIEFKVFMCKLIHSLFFFEKIMWILVFLVGYLTWVQLDFHPKWEQSIFNVRTKLRIVLRIGSPSENCPTLIRIELDDSGKRV
jgi:hypothetical protein